MYCEDHQMSALLEVIALTAEDARAAQAGGADRLEVVSDIAADGLTPTVATVAQIRAACDLELRVMLRDTEDFVAGDLTPLMARAEKLAEAGADGFVLGFLNPDQTLDLAAMRQLADAGGLPWTCHRAIDYTADYRGAFDAVAGTPGMTQVLTAGGPEGLSTGLDNVVAVAASGQVMAGGGLREEHIAPLRAAGVRAFHIGSGARRDWRTPVLPDLVSRWRTAINE